MLHRLMILLYVGRVLVFLGTVCIITKLMVPCHRFNCVHFVLFYMNLRGVLANEEKVLWRVDTVRSFGAKKVEM